MIRKFRGRNLPKETRLGNREVLHHQPSINEPSTACKALHRFQKPFCEHYAFSLCNLKANQSFATIGIEDSELRDKLMTENTPRGNLRSSSIANRYLAAFREGIFRDLRLLQY